MPKRTRDDEVKANCAPPSTGEKAPVAQLSAFARRQLLQSQRSASASPALTLTVSPTPVPFPVPADESILPASTQKQKNLKKKKKNVATSEAITPTEIQKSEDESNILKKREQNVGTRKKLESALARKLEDARRRKGGGGETGEELAAAATETVDNIGMNVVGEDEEDVMSVDENENDEGSRVTTVNGRGKSTQISTFIPSEDNTIRTPGISTTYRLKASETIVLQGEYTLRVLSGSITISGATLTPESGTHTVFAPTTHALPVIEGVTKSRGGTKGEDDFVAEIVVGCYTSGIRDIGKLWSLFKGIWAPPTILQKDDSFHILTSTTSPTTILTIPPMLSHFLSDFAAPSPHPPTVLLAGSKSSGKSTLSRILTNTLLNSYSKVAYLDLDPGQPEFSPPGMISLSLITSPILGPPFTHPAGPVGNTTAKRVRAHHIGFVSPREDPGAYVQSTADLVQAYRHYVDSSSEDVGIPLVINTCGWIKGTGIELLQDIINLVQPSDMVLLHPQSLYYSDNASNAIGDVHSLLPHSTRFYHIPPPPLSVASLQKFSAADLRTLHTMSYFHHTHHWGGGTDSYLSWSFTHALTHTPPHLVPVEEIKAGIHILNLTPSLPSHLLGDAIEGTIVGLVLVNGFADDDNENPPLSPPLQSQSQSQSNPDDTSSPFPYPPPIPLPLPHISHSPGLVLIRALDQPNNQIQVIFPPGDRYLSEANNTPGSEGELLALVRGRLESPLWDFVSDDADVIGYVSGERMNVGVAVVGEGDVPWISYEGFAGQGGGKGVREWRVRRNLMRRGQKQKRVSAAGGGGR